MFWAWVGILTADYVAGIPVAVSFFCSSALRFPSYDPYQQRLKDVFLVIYPPDSTSSASTVKSVYLYAGDCLQVLQLFSESFQACMQGFPSENFMLQRHTAVLILLVDCLRVVIVPQMNPSMLIGFSCDVVYVM